MLSSALPRSGDDEGKVFDGSVRAVPANNLRKAERPPYWPYGRAQGGQSQGQTNHLLSK